MTASRYTRAREMAGLSIGQAVRRLNARGDLRDWSVAMLTDVETGEHDPETPTRNALADLYVVSAAWLRGAKPVVPVAAQQALDRNPRLSDEDRAGLLELFGAIYTPESRR